MKGGGGACGATGRGIHNSAWNAEQSASPCDSLCERPLPAGSREGEGGLGACARTSMRELDGAYGWARAHKKTCGPPGIGRQQHSTPRAAA